jgi:hypothetical protein
LDHYLVGRERVDEHDVPSKPSSPNGSSLDVRAALAVALLGDMGGLRPFLAEFLKPDDDEFTHLVAL